MQESGRMRVSRLGVTAGVLILIVIAALVVVSIGHAQEGEEKGKDWSLLFDKTEVTIAARDGVKLHTEIYAPKDAKEAMPIVLERTPYGLNDDEKGFSRKLGRYVEMIPDDYIFVFQDIRGRYGSEGTFVMQRPVRDATNLKAIDEGTDTYDTIDWLVKNVPRNNGRVGLLGISYGGGVVGRGGFGAQPAAKGGLKQGSPAREFPGGDFHSNGA